MRILSSCENANYAQERNPRQCVIPDRRRPAEMPRADSRTRASRRDRPSPRWFRLLRCITPGGNDLSRLVDFGAATVATPGVCGSGELSGAASEHCRQNRKRKSAADWNGNWSRQEVKRRHVLSGRRTKTLRGYWMAVVEFLEDGLAPFKKVCEPTLRPTLPRIRRRHRHQHLVEATLVRAKAPSVKILMLKRDG